MSQKRVECMRPISGDSIKVGTMISLLEVAIIMEMRHILQRSTQAYSWQLEEAKLQRVT